MPTTDLLDATFAVRAIAARTAADGSAVDDLSGEEDRLINLVLTEGRLSANAFRVQAAGGMDLSVGSGSARADVYAIQGEAAGQGVYLVRLDDATATVPVPPAEASSVRVDELYLVVQDDPYDSSLRALPRLGYRKGDAGGGNPGAFSGWMASALLCRITVPAAATEIVPGNLSDQRATSRIAPFLVTDLLSKSGGTMTGQLTVPSALQVQSQDGASEGGEIHLLGAGAHGTVALDNFQAVLRLFMAGSGVNIASFGTGLARIFSTVLQVDGNIRYDAAKVARVDGPTEGMTSATFADLTTPGPAVTVTIGASGRALVTVGTYIAGGQNADAQMGFEVSGATTRAAAEAESYRLFTAGSEATGGSRTFLISGLTAGSNTFTAKYRRAAGSSVPVFKDREISVIPL